jgi:hypothetical protein
MTSHYDQNKWEFEINKSVAERAHDNETEFGHKANEAAINSANAAIRIALLMNGGAAVSVLAFIGGLVGQKVIPISDFGKNSCWPYVVYDRCCVCWRISGVCVLY